MANIFRDDADIIEAARWWPRIMSREFRKNSVWLEITPAKLRKQMAYARGNNTIIADNYNSSNSMFFLLPEEILENINHTWSEYESTAGNVMEKIAKLGKGIQEIGGVTNAVKSTGKTAGGFMSSKNMTAEGGERIAQAAMGTAATLGSNLSKIPVYPYRLDTSLVYQSSSRREFNLTFRLADQGDPYKDVFDPVRTLTKLSAPSKKGNLVQLDFPYVFRIRTKHGTGNVDLINLEYAAMTSVQPTFRQPYRDGYPTLCDLTLTFVDLEPLFSDSFKQSKSLVTVGRG